METMTQEFEPITLYVDHARVDKAMKMYNRWAQEADAALKEAGALFDNGLTLEQKQLVLEKGWNAVADLIKANSQFPKADIKTILSLEGKDGSAARAALLHVPERHHAVGFSIINNEVVVDPETENKLIEEATVRTSSLEGNKALEMAKKMAADWQKCLDNGWVTEHDSKRFSDSIKILVYDNIQGVGYRVQPNYHIIKDL